MPSSTPLNVSWLGSDPYEGGYRHLTVTFSDPAVSQTVSPSGLFPESAGLEHVLIWDQFVDPYGWPSPGAGLKSSVLSPKQYGPAIWHLSASWEGAEVYLPPALTITATWTNISYVMPRSIEDPAIPEPRLYWEEFARPDGIDSLDYGPVAILHPWQYVPSRYLRDASWVGKDEYTPATGDRDGVWRIPVEDAYIATIGFTQSDFGQPEVYLYTRYVEASGDDHAGAGTAHEVWNWAKIVKPSGTNELTFSSGAEIRVLNRRLHLDGFQTAAFGEHALESTFFDVFPHGNAHEAFGRPKLALGARRYDIKGFVATYFGAAVLENLTKQAWPQGTNQSAIGAHEIENTSHAIRLNGMVATKFPAGWPNVWNLRQILKGKGFSALGLGKPSITGGQVTIEIKGLSLLKFGTATVFDPRADQYIELSAGIPAPGFGWVNVSPRMVNPTGINSAKLGLPAVDFHFYEGGGLRVESWDSLVAGEPRVQHLSRVVRPDGIDSVVFGATSVSNFDRGITVPSIRDAGVFGDLLLYNKRIQVQLQGFDALEIPNWTVIYSNRRFLLGRGFNAESFGQSGVDNYATTIEPWGADQSCIGSPSAELLTRYLATYGSDYGFLGRPAIGNMLKTVLPAGIGSKLAFGKPAIKNLARFVYPSSAATGPAFGRPHIWNLLQIRKLPGFDASEFGEPFFGGGVRHIAAGGREYLAFGGAEVINTTADQTVRVRSIEAPPISGVRVSPRFVYLESFDASGQGEPTVQFPPMPDGWVSSIVGRPAIGDWHQQALPEGWDSMAVGFPEPRDRAQTVFTPSILGTGIFGDTQARNNRLVVTVDGLDFFESSGFAEVRSNRRALEAKSFEAQTFGGTGIRNKTPSFAPVGNDLAEYGRPSIGYHVRYLYVRGTDYLKTGWPTVDQTPSIAPKGWEGEAGTPVVWRFARNYELDGWDSFTAGDSTTIWYRVRKLQAQGAAKVQPAHGKPRLEHGNRMMLAQGESHDRSGRPRVSNANRWIYPEGYFEEFAVVHRVGGTQVVDVFGFNAAEFGTRIVPPVRRIEFEQGIFSEAIAWPALYNRTTVLEPIGATTGQQPADRWGTGRVFNAIQHIELYYFHESDLNPPEGSRWTLIENRNKQLRTSGVRFDRHGNATLEHAARLLHPVGIESADPGEFYQSGMVGYRVRELPLQGMEPPYISGWSRAYNDAFVLAPDGFRAGVYGDAEAKTLRRYFKGIGRFDAAEYGTPMVADRIRELWIEPRYTIGAPRINLHTVDLYTRYIEAKGEDLSRQSGWHDLISRFNRITTRWSHSDAIGWAALRNLTPEVGIYGAASDVYGDAHVRLEWRPLNAIGSRMDLFGRGSVTDRDRSMTVRGFKSGAVNDRLEVIQGGQPPYTDQHIDLAGHGAMDPIERLQVSEPSFNLYVLEAQGFKTESYGDPFIQSNAIIVGDEPPHDGYGVPRVWRMLQTIQAGEGPGAFDPSAAVVSPHTIWARPAPNQANRNHNPPGSPWRPVGATSRYSAGERFGDHRVSTWRGEVKQRRAPSPPSLPRPKLSLVKRYIVVNGIRAYRAGWQKLGDGNQEVVQFGAGRFDALGKPAVKRPPYTGPQWIHADAASGNDVGSPKAEHFHRQIYPKGSRMNRMGYSHGGPYQYQGLAVHPPMPTIPGGFDAYRASEEHWIAPRVREVKCQGYETFASEYDLKAFAKRMTVRNAYVPTPPKRELAPVGMDVSGAGVPNVMPAVHFIKPDGNADQFRKGGY